MEINYCITNQQIIHILFKFIVKESLTKLRDKNEQIPFNHCCVLGGSCLHCDWYLQFSFIIFYNVTFLSLASLTRSTFLFICFLSLFHLAVSNSLNDPKMNTLPKSECILHAGCLNHIACKLCAYQDCKCDHGKCKCLRPEPPSQ